MPPEALERVIKIEGEHVREKNLLQIELASRLYGGKDSQRFIEEWIPKYSKKFGELFEQEIADNPNFFAELSDPARRKEILEKFEKLLYEDDVEMLEKAA